MAVVNDVYEARNLEIADAESFIFYRGDGRKFRQLTQERRDKVPANVDIVNFATHQVIVKWTRIDKESVIYNNVQPEWASEHTKDATNKPIVVIMGSSEGTGRPTASKVLITQDRKECYGFLTWTELFGSPVKECQMQRSDKGTIWHYVVKMTPASRDAVLAALESIGVKY